MNFLLFFPHSSFFHVFTVNTVTPSNMNICLLTCSVLQHTQINFGIVFFKKKKKKKKKSYAYMYTFTST